MICDSVLSICRTRQSFFLDLGKKAALMAGF
jgi:hypothetical protein